VGYVGMKCRKMAVWGGVGMWMWCCVGCVRFGCEGLCVFGWLCGFLVQFLGELLAVREPAGCVHACSKWQTSGFPLQAGGTEWGHGSPKERAIVSSVLVIGMSRAYK
jgi:hypothetical protein